MAIVAISLWISVAPDAGRVMALDAPSLSFSIRPLNRALGLFCWLLPGQLPGCLRYFSHGAGVKPWCERAVAMHGWENYKSRFFDLSRGTHGFSQLSFRIFVYFLLSFNNLDTLLSFRVSQALIPRRRRSSFCYPLVQ
jgi:hypothetical protein